MSDIIYKKLKFKARRGMLELDLLFQRYLDNNFHCMSDIHKQQFEDLMELTDPELLDMLINENTQGNTDYRKLKDVINHIIESK